MKPHVISGGCLCGAVRYEVTGPPANITHCHCADCRRSSGAPFVTWATFRRGAFKLLTGLPKGLRWAGRWRTFCPYCGTPLTFLTRPDAPEIHVTVCSFDDPASVTPCNHAWIEDRLRWIRLVDSLPRYGQRGLPHSA